MHAGIYRLTGGWLMACERGRSSYKPLLGITPARILAYASRPEPTPPTPMMGSFPFVSRYRSRSTSVDISNRGRPLSPPAC